MTDELNRALTAAREAVELGAKARQWTPEQLEAGAHIAVETDWSRLREHAALHYPTVARALIAQAERVRVLEGLLRRTQKWIPRHDEILDRDVDAALTGGRDGS